MHMHSLSKSANLKYRESGLLLEAPRERRQHKHLLMSFDARMLMLPLN